MSLPADPAARTAVERLGLEPHPEGGWFRRTWTAPTPHSAGRAAGSSIVYLLDGCSGSHWHRIDATESWVHLEGSPVVVRRWSTAGGSRSDVIGGGSPSEGGHYEVVVAPGEWQCARSEGSWSLVTCTVVPEFRYEGFELAPPGWEPPEA